MLLIPPCSRAFFLAMIQSHGLSNEQTSRRTEHGLPECLLTGGAVGGRLYVLFCAHSPRSPWNSLTKQRPGRLRGYSQGQQAIPSTPTPFTPSSRVTSTGYRSHFSTGILNIDCTLESLKIVKDWGFLKTPNRGQLHQNLCGWKPGVSIF